MPFVFIPQASGKKIKRQAELQCTHKFKSILGKWKTLFAQLAACVWICVQDGAVELFTRNGVDSKIDFLMPHLRLELFPWN